MSRVVHTTAAYQGVVLANPGGPGGSGLGLSTLGGVPCPRASGSSTTGSAATPGASAPACRRSTATPRYFAYDRPDYVATTSALQTYWLTARPPTRSLRRPQRPAAANHLTTRDNVRDMESIRLALGQQQINYYGFSYGTYLGQVYATCSRPTCGGRCWTATSTRSGSVRRATGPGRAFTVTIKAFFTWVAEARRHLPPRHHESAVEALYYGVSTSCGARRATAARSVPTSGTTRSCRPATTS